MKVTSRCGGIFRSFCVILAVACSGCSEQEAAKQLQQAEKAAEKAAGTVSGAVTEAVQASEKVAGELGEKALAHLDLLKEKFGKLEALKDSPADLKTAVTDLIQTIETKAEDVHLPEKLSSALAAIKEKLVALERDLAGEIEQSQIGERIKEIMDTAKKELSMSAG
jgi:hypothetical protein